MDQDHDHGGQKKKKRVEVEFDDEWCERLIDDVERKLDDFERKIVCFEILIVYNRLRKIGGDEYALSELSDCFWSIFLSRGTTNYASALWFRISGGEDQSRESVRKLIDLTVRYGAIFGCDRGLEEFTEKILPGDKSEPDIYRARRMSKQAVKELEREIVRRVLQFAERYIEVHQES